MGQFNSDLLKRFIAPAIDVFTVLGCSALGEAGRSAGGHDRQGTYHGHPNNSGPQSDSLTPFSRTWGRGGKR